MIRHVLGASAGGESVPQRKGGTMIGQNLSSARTDRGRLGQIRARGGGISSG